MPGTTRTLSMLIALLMLLPGVGTLRGATLLVFAAASLTDSLKEIGSEFERQTRHRVTFSFGASSFLARQIEEGAPADIFFSADEARMDGLEAKGLVAPGSRFSRLSNRLVIVVRTGSSLQLKSSADLAASDVKRIALADPKTVPAGIYAREHLEKAGLWPQLARRVVPTDNVRAALAAVESGNVDAGIVYRTDAAMSRQVRVAHEIPAAVTPDIRYSVAAVKDCKQIEAARGFLRHLATDEAGRVFEKFGFIVIEVPRGSPASR